MTDVALSDFQGTPWSRQRGDDGELESHLWYHRFRTFYLPQGPDRSLLEANNRWRDNKGKDRTNNISGSWIRNAEKWRWKERAEAFDLEEQRKRIAEEEEARREMRRRQIRYFQGMQWVAASEIDKIVARVRQGGDADLSEGEIRRWLVDGATQESKARGIPEHILAVTTMSNDELLQYIQALLSAPAGDTVGTGRGADGGEGEEPRPPWATGDDD